MEAAGAGVTVSVVAGACPCTSLWKPTTVPANPERDRHQRRRAGREVQERHRRLHHRDPLLQGPGEHRHAHRQPVDDRRHAAGHGRVHRTRRPPAGSRCSFATPVAITANTTYVASYHTNVGGYACDGGYFATTGVDSPPLHALPSDDERRQRRVQYGGERVPDRARFNATNYWVDVVFAPSLHGHDRRWRSRRSRPTTIDRSTVTVTWTTNEHATSRIDYGTDPDDPDRAISTPPAGTLTVTNASFVTQHTRDADGPARRTRPTTTCITAVDRLRQRDDGGGAQLHGAGSDAARHGLDRFRRRHAGAGTYVSQTADGEVILAPTAGVGVLRPGAAGRLDRSAVGHRGLLRRSSTACSWSTARVSRRA